MKHGWLMAATLALAAGCADEAPERTQPAAAADTGAEVIVYLSPHCGCCSVWVDYMREQGFEVTVHQEMDVDARRRALGVPDALASCHTAVVGGYLVEGHVPADVVRRLLAEVPDARGVAVPGMPVGSPGMEVGDRVDEYAVMLFDDQGNSRVYARYRGHDRL